MKGSSFQGKRGRRTRPRPKIDLRDLSISGFLAYPGHFGHEYAVSFIVGDFVFLPLERKTAIYRICVQKLKQGQVDHEWPQLMALASLHLGFDKGQIILCSLGIRVVRAKPFFGYLPSLAQIRD